MALLVQPVSPTTRWEILRLPTLSTLMLMKNSALNLGLGSGGGPWHRGWLGGGDADVSGDELYLGLRAFGRGFRLATFGLFTCGFVGGAFSLIPTPACPKVESDSSFPYPTCLWHGAPHQRPTHLNWPHRLYQSLGTYLGYDCRAYRRFGYITRSIFVVQL